MNRVRLNALPSTSTSSHLPYVPRMFVAFQCPNGQSYLTSTSLASTSTSSPPTATDLIQHVRACYHRMVVADKHETWISRLFVKTIAGTAEVCQIFPPSPTAECSCHRVYLSDFEYHWLLTEAFHKPDTLPARIVYTPDTHDGDDTPPPDRRIITLRRVLDKTKVARLLIMMLVISPSLGIIVSHLSNSAAAGIAASAGVFALASFVQGLTAWIAG